MYALNCRVGRDCIECECDVKRCPTPCDSDCQTSCHEAHEVTQLRDHDPSECPSATHCDCGEAA